MGEFTNTSFTQLSLKVIAEVWLGSNPYSQPIVAACLLFDSVVTTKVFNFFFNFVNDIVNIIQYERVQYHQQYLLHC